MEDLIGPIIINLDHRTDRWSQVVGEVEQMGFIPTRFSAIKDSDGAAGCLASHIRILEDNLSKNRPIFIIEDDAQLLVSKEILNNIIKKFLDSSGDLLCLAYNSLEHLPFDEIFNKAVNVQTTAAYIIKPSVQHKLLDIWKNAYEFRKTGKRDEINEAKFNNSRGRFGNSYYYADQCWKIIQLENCVLIPKIRPIWQRQSFSDIEGKVMFYRC